MRILMIGAQGSGKSTQAELLAKELDMPRISTGDIFRKIAQENSPRGERIRQIQNSGNLVDDQETAKIVEERLKEDDVKKGFVLDGYPRNLTQKDLFDPGFDRVFYLKVEDHELISRLTKRGRTDDTLEGIKKRLNLYHEQTEPLLDYYRNLGILTEINGAGDIEKVHNEIKKSI